MPVQCTKHNCKILCFSSTISESSCFARAMSTIEDDPQSPELGNRSIPSQPPKISESSQLEKEMSEEEDEEQVTKKKRTLKRDTREWTVVLSLQTGDESGFDDEEVNHQMYQEAKKLMEKSGLCKLSTHKPKDSDLHLWKKKIGWSTVERTETHVGPIFLHVPY